MSSIAVFLVVAGGSAFAAGKLGKNTVGTQQLKKNAVTSVKVKNAAVTGAKIADGSITSAKLAPGAVGAANINTTGLTVPNAQNAQAANSAQVASSAQVANSLAPLEATHIVGAAGQPLFESGSSNAPGEQGLNFPPAGFYKDHDGIVHLQGMVKGGDTSTPFIFRLPPGFRPATGTVFVQTVFCYSKIGSCSRDSKGDEETYGKIIIGGSNTSSQGVELDGRVFGIQEGMVSLEGVTFKAES